jgi:ATP-dependent Lon protease
MSREDERLDIGDASVEHPIAIPSELPILPLRDSVLFPNSVLPLAVARESSVRLIEEAISGSKLVGVFTQRDAAVEEPGQDELHQIGTATHIHKMFKLPDGSLRLIVQGLSRLQLASVIATRPYLRATGSRSTRCSGTSRPTFSTSSRCRRCCRTISRRSR